MAKKPKYKVEFGAGRPYKTPVGYNYHIYRRSIGIFWDYIGVSYNTYAEAKKAVDDMNG